MNFIQILSLFAIVLMGCTNSNELKPIDSQKEGLKTGIFEKSSGTASNSMSANGEIHSLHTVTVQEHIGGKRYSYMKVRENDTEYWIATMKGDFKVQSEYMYQEGLEKTDYNSTELARTFDRIVLVSQLMDVHSDGHNHSTKPTTSNEITIDNTETIAIPKSSTPIKSIVANPNNFKNKTVEITGRIVKVNPGIMDRNWIHVYDGTNGNYDFVCTSNQDVPVGHLITLKGTIVTNKDFGAGYTYDIMMENAQVK